MKTLADDDGASPRNHRCRHSIRQRNSAVLRGELDVDTAPLALPNLAAVVDAAAVVVVGLEHLAFIDLFGADVCI